VIAAEQPQLLDRVLVGKVPLLAAARQVEAAAVLVAAYNSCGPGARETFARAVGVESLFDGAIVPALG